VKSWTEYAERFAIWKKIEAIADPEKQTAAALRFAGNSSQWSDYRHPRPETPGLSDYYRENDVSLYSLLSNEDAPITGAEACALYFSDHSEPGDPEENRSVAHLTLRLAYEMQMLEAQGGRAALVEMEVGGFIGGHQIRKVNKSNATGRVVSVGVMVKTNGRNQWGNPYPEGKDPVERLELLNVERLAESAYRAPTEEEKAAFQKSKKEAKAKAPKSTAPALVNPTLEDAQRLQSLINERHLAEWTLRHGKASGAYKAPEPVEVCAITQATYSANSSGTYARAGTRGLCGNGQIEDATSNMWTSKAAERAKLRGPAVCKIRITGYDPVRVIHITDKPAKPAKPLPAAVWAEYVAPVETKADEAANA
jgi:hypothetical protein